MMTVRRKQAALKRYVGRVARAFHSGMLPGRKARLHWTTEIRRSIVPQRGIHAPIPPTFLTDTLGEPVLFTWRAHERRQM